MMNVSGCFNPRSGARLLACFLVFCACGALAVVAQAQQSLEILELRHRPVEEVLPVLRPLLEPGGTLSGMNDRLFLRASPRNREEIKKALAALDAPARRLLIRVATDLEAATQDQGGALSGSLGNDRARVTVSDGRSNNRGERNQVTARAYGHHSSASGAATQTVQTLDGGRAFIQVGVSLAVPLRQVTRMPNGRVVVSDHVEYRDIGRGFYVEPHVLDDRVTVDILQMSDTPGGHGAAQIQHLLTRVSGPLGEWIALGGVDQSASETGSGTFSLSTRELQNQRGIWLMVEELP
jgi:type II secretory pathway component GspD/PulD (secretin)